MIKHIQGDIFKSGSDVILHQVNCQGMMNTGVAKQVREKYPWVFKSYKYMCEENANHKDNLLGIAHKVPIDEKRFIVNLFAQKDYGYDGKCYTNYNALKKCLQDVNSKCAGKTVAIPYLMGCHRGGGDWDIVSQIIEETLINCDVTLYEYCGG